MYVQNMLQKIVYIYKYIYRDTIIIFGIYIYIVWYICIWSMKNWNVDGSVWRKICRTHVHFAIELASSRISYQPTAQKVV